MGVCSWCGSGFTKTRADRKYCTPRCKTNACLGRKPRRLRAADVERLYELIDAEVDSADALREHLRAILRPDLPPVPLKGGRAVVPRMD